MSELRWILLVLGVLFIAALAWWEMRKPRQGRSDEAERSSGREPVFPPASEEHGSIRRLREPTLTLPEIRPRESVREPPIIESIDDDSRIGLRIDGERIEDEAGEEEAEPAEPPVEPIVPAPETPPVRRPPPLDVAPEPVEPIVEWPEESLRRILALRLVAPATERFPGRALRQALAAEGFVLGKFSIFHKPGPDARAVVSAASLTRPGTFDLATMDVQRFGGLSLFAVLPGPLPAAETFDELLTTARNLNARLRGALQDEHGQPLTPARVAAIRESLREQTTDAAAPQPGTTESPS